MDGWIEVGLPEAAAISEGYCPRDRSRLVPYTTFDLSEPAAVWARCVVCMYNYAVTDGTFEVADEALYHLNELWVDGGVTTMIAPKVGT